MPAETEAEPVLRDPAFYATRAAQFFESYLRHQAKADNWERIAAEQYRNEGAASHAMKHEAAWWQYREVCTLRDRDMAVATMSALMALVAKAAVS